MSQLVLDLSVVHAGAAVHYATVKAVSSLIWDVRLGIFGGHPEGHSPSFDFLLDDPEWEDSIERLDGPMETPTYGTVQIDFDRRLILDANSYGLLDTLNFQWFQASLKAAVDNEEGGLLTPATIRTLLSEGRLSIISDHGDPTVRLPGDLREALSTVRATRGVDRWVKVDFPDGWRIQRKVS